MIQEVRIDTANFDASFGHSTGLGISMMTRSGTNTMHGSTNYQYWNNQWNAPTYFAKKNYYDNIAQATAKGDTATASLLSSRPINPIGKSNNLANTFGGPVIKDKLFVFVNYSWNHDDRPAPSQTTIPTAANLQGDFSNLSRDRPGALSDLRPAHRQARPRAARLLHSRSVSRERHPGR